MLPDDNFVFLAWPVTVVHRINEESPLWDMSLEQLLQVMLPCQITSAKTVGFPFT